MQRWVVLGIVQAVLLRMNQSPGTSGRRGEEA